MMRYFAAAAKKDLARIAKDPIALLTWVGIPIVLGGLMTLVSSGGGGSSPTAQLVVTDLDDSLLSGFLVGAFGQGPLAEMVEVEQLELEPGRARVDAGDVSAQLVIPAGFGAALLAETPTALELITNPAQRILPGILEESLSMLSEAAFYVHRVFGDQLRDLTQGMDAEAGPSSAEVARISVAIRDSIERLQGTLFPPVLSLASTTRSVEDEQDDLEWTFGILLLPSVLFMALFFVAQGLSEDLWVEREQGTLRRAAIAPAPFAQFLLGKLGAGAVVFAGVTAVGLFVGCSWHGLPLSRLPACVLWAALSGLVLQLLLLTMQSLASTRRAGSILTNVALFPLLMIGGGFLPLEALPDGMAAIGSWTPNGWAMIQLKEVLLYGRTGLAFGGAIVVQLAIGALLFLVTHARLSRSFLQA